MAVLIAIVGGAVVIVGTVALLSILRGFVLTMLWGWFIVPTFAGAPHLSIVPAIGLSLVVSFLTYTERGKDDRSKAEQLGLPFLYPLLVLLIGWIIHLFM